MIKNICIYPNYRILGAVKATTFTNKEGATSKRCSFAASSYYPDSNGIFNKIYCYAFDREAEEIVNANLQNEDIVTLFTEQNKYNAGNGVIEDRYRVLSLNYVKKKNKATDSQPEQTQNNQPGEPVVEQQNSSLNEFAAFMTSLIH